MRRKKEEGSLFLFPSLGQRLVGKTIYGMIRLLSLWGLKEDVA
jgi:hypothetical protein